MPKKIFGSQARLMVWEWHLLDAIVRSPFSTLDLHRFLLEIYECTDSQISFKDTQRALSYLRSLNFIKFRSGFYVPTDSGSSFVLWINHIESVKFEYFKKGLL